MRADDEGFINNPKRITRMIGASDDDLKLLIGKRFVLAFESGVIVIKHWKMHNYIQSDRFKPTVYQEERKQLVVKDNKSYAFESPPALENTQCIQDGYNMDTQVRLGKVRLGKDSIGKAKDNIYSPATHDIIDYLNERTGKSYKYTTKKTITLIKARLDEKFTVDDFKTVIDKKCAEWTGTDFEQYLRPVTLFGTKFESYLNQSMPNCSTSFLDLE